MIDVIIPIYHATKTLPLTLMSILLQKGTFDLRVTLVNDADDDNYQEIINRFQTYFPIQYFRLDQNSGPGIAREKGMEITQGEYILFMDSDDLLFDTDSLEKLYQKIKEGYDLVSGIEVIENAIMKQLNESNVHGKIYRRSFLKDHDIHFNHTRVHEDNFFNNSVILKGAKTAIVESDVYLYCTNPNSLTTVSSEKEFVRLEILLSNVKQIMDEIPVTKENADSYISFIFGKYKYYKRIYPNFSSEQKEIFLNWLKKYDPKHYHYLDIEDLDELRNRVREDLFK